ncbi:hypothetical protein HY415_01980 [Candidatus Kaiserbacteria bacterium]|nr:hypothetical protein [Candidatus Kaiserbacteria bacterium]
MIKKVFDLSRGEVCWLNRQTFISLRDQDQDCMRYFRVIGTALIKETEYDIEVLIRLAQVKGSARQWVLVYNSVVQLDSKPKGAPISKLDSTYEPSSRIAHLAGIW